MATPILVKIIGLVLVLLVKGIFTNAACFLNDLLILVRAQRGAFSRLASPEHESVGGFSTDMRIKSTSEPGSSALYGHIENQKNANSPSLYPEKFGCSATGDDESKRSCQTASEDCCGSVDRKNQNRLLRKDSLRAAKPASKFVALKKQDILLEEPGTLSRSRQCCRCNCENSALIDGQCRMCHKHLSLYGLAWPSRILNGGIKISGSRKGITDFTIPGQVPMSGRHIAFESRGRYLLSEDAKPMLVFVDPLDSHARFWWPAMVLRLLEMDSLFLRRLFMIR